MLTMKIHPHSHYLEMVKVDKTLVTREKDCELDLERCELVGGQIMM